MLRATVWTVGLFGAGAAICRAFPSTWTEPLVLFGLGLALLLVSVHTARPRTATAGARPLATVAPNAMAGPRVHSPLAAAAQVATAAQVAAAPVQVEQTA